MFIKKKINGYSEYEKTHNHIPHGNKSNEAHAVNKTFVYDDLCESLFIKV